MSGPFYCGFWCPVGLRHCVPCRSVIRLNTSFVTIEPSDSVHLSFSVGSYDSCFGHTNAY